LIHVSQNRYEGFLSDFVENMDDRAFSTVPVMGIIFREFSLDITKEERVTWCEVRAVSQVPYRLDFFA
jgi:hypothetical protein